MNKIDINKKYRTRNGATVRVLCVDARGSQPVVALVTGVSGQENVTRHTAYGWYWHDAEGADYDLLEIPELEFDWSCLPAWAEWITWGGGYGWIWWKNKPILGDVEVWFDQLADLRGAIPSDFLPIYNGSDPAPIFKRPSKEGGEA